MPQRCPGHPNCAKTFCYPNALRAHLLMCPHAQQRFARKTQLSRLERTQPADAIALHTAIGLQERTIVGDQQLASLRSVQPERRGSMSSTSIGSDKRKAQQPQESQWVPKYEVLTRRFSDRFGSPFDASGPLTDSCALAIRRGINKGCVLISRRGAPSELVDAEKPTFRREFTNYWALEGPEGRLLYSAVSVRSNSQHRVSSADDFAKP